MTPEQKERALEILNDMPVIDTTPRKNTNKLLEMVEEGLLDKDQVILACVKYMSEDEVTDMMEANEFVEPDYE